jgi:23S rRNA (cytosine1962-C5)-methyltransferase
MHYPVVSIKKYRSYSLLRRHPRVFSGAIHHIDGAPEDGDLVIVTGPDGSFLGTGHFQSKGSIQVRILSFSEQTIDESFWQKRLADAVAMRKQLGLGNSPQTNAFRLVHAEGDGLPGLVIDWYNGHVVIQPHSSGMQKAVPVITDTISALLGSSLLSVSVAGQEQDTHSCEITEHGHRFHVDWLRGQKTGFFLDQRENRRLVTEYAKDKTVLNAFSYSGGFSVYALKAGAKKVYSLDSSQQAIAWAEQNVALNDIDPARHQSVTADAMKYLKHLPEQFDLMVLDPPAFAKHLSARHRAIQAYRRINAYAFSQIAPGGIVFTFSCSQAVTQDLFRGAILAAGIDAERNIRILHQLHQPPDHPVNLFHPESEYLKGFVLQVGGSP